MSTGSSIIGSLATSSTWYPGGRKNVFISSSGESTGEAVGAACSAGGHEPVA